MNLKSFALSLGVLLLGGTAFPAAAAPYLVYQGTIVQTSSITHGEGAWIQSKINANLASFHKLPAALQKEATTALTSDAGSTTTAVYLIVDEQNVANYTFVLLDPGSTGGITRSIVSSNLPSSALPENFISGFTYPTKGGLGLFRLGFVRSTGNDPVTGQPASFLLQGFGTGALNTTASAQIAPKQAAVTFFTYVNGVKGAQHIVPSFPAILSAAGASYIPSITSDALFGYYFDDSAAQSIGGSSTKGTFTLLINPTLTQLANNGGRYESTAKNIGLVAPISASTAAAYTTWAKSLLSISFPPTN